MNRRALLYSLTAFNIVAVGYVLWQLSKLL